MAGCAHLNHSLTNTLNITIPMKPPNSSPPQKCIVCKKLQE
jgi:hypothetical protein